MADYGKRYQVTFDPPGGGSFVFRPRYKLYILQKNYTGGVQNLKGGPGGVKQNWQTDEPKPAIKGSSLTASILNEGSLPLSTFYSTDDDEFKVQLYWTENVLLLQPRENLIFEGFVVQDDCSEILIDSTHEIILQATDGLGLLKDIALDKAPASYEYVSSGVSPVQGVSNHVIYIGSSVVSSLNDKSKIEIAGGAAAGTYTVVSVSGNNVTVIETVPVTSSYLATLTIYQNTLLEKVTLLSIIKRCLSATGLELPTNIYCNLWEKNHLNTSPYFAQTLVDGQSFLKSDSDYEDCYTVLERVFRKEEKGAMLTIFQSNGVWNIVRWNELRYYNNNIPGFIYDKDFNLTGTKTLSDAFDIDIFNPTSIPDTFPETGLVNRISRPDLFVKETFNYKQPKQLLKNYNLEELGNLRNSYISGTNTIKEYDAPWWYPSPGVTVSEYFIRVTISNSGIDAGKEIERSLIVRKAAVQSYKIEVNKNDYFKLTYSFRTSQIYNGPANIVSLIKLTDGTITKYVKGSSDSTLSTWENTFGFTYKVLAGDSAKDNWQSVTIESAAIPFDGLLYIQLPSVLPSPNETIYRDIRLEYITIINGSSKVIGQTHKSEQTASIKQNESETIYLDDSPRNPIEGTLFLNSQTGLLQTRTSQWHRGHIPLEKRKQGNISTVEHLQWKMKPRTILEGNFIGLLHNNNHAHISMLNVFRCSITPELNYLFGKLEIDYRNNMFNGTLWEIYKDGEADVTSDYEFKYLYDTK